MRLLEPDFVGGMLIFVLMMTGLVIYFWKKRDFLAGLLFIFFLMCSTLVIVEYIFKLTYLTADAIEVYIPTAISIANGWHKSIFDSIVGINLWDLLTKGIPAYVYPLAAIFYLSNNSLIAASLFSTFFGILTVYALFHITKDIYDLRTAKLTAILLVFSPYYCLLSTLILRDTMAIFFLVWFFRLWLLYDQQPRRKYMFLMLFSLFYLGLLRPPVMLVVLFVIALYKVYFNPRKRLKILKIMTLGVLALVITLALNHIMANQDMSKIRLLKGVTYADFDEMNRRAGEASGSKSSYWQGLKYNTYLDVVTYMPLLIIYFMCSPFPWEVTKASQFAALIDSGVLWVLYIFFFLEIRSFIKRNKKWAAIILAYLILGIASASLVQGNVGGAMRHRTLFTVFIIPLAAHQILTRFSRKRVMLVKDWRGLTPATGGREV
jgi:4-amino-4-deoxy-L-arabinose transferase-like glycosyltransferase